MKCYLDIVQDVLKNGSIKKNRTGVDTISLPGAILRHDMSLGYPLLTTKKMPFSLIASELEFFIGGYTNKDWLRERNNHIWDEWCSPDVLRDDGTPDVRLAMNEESELGPIYGWQWRHFGATYTTCYEDYKNFGVDQLDFVVKELKFNPDSRRMIVSAWNPSDLSKMALPPCHYSFQVTVTEGKLNLFWNQRSVDVALGLPFNIASYGLLLHLLAKESNLKEGYLVGFLADTHIYVNHISNLKIQLSREPFVLPTIRTDTFSSIFQWSYSDTVVENYQCHPKLSFDIAV